MWLVLVLVLTSGDSTRRPGKVVGRMSCVPAAPPYNVGNPIQSSQQSQDLTQTFTPSEDMEARICRSFYDISTTATKKKVNLPAYWVDNWRQINTVR